MAQKGRLLSIPVDELIVSPDLQMRASGLDEDHARDIAEFLKVKSHHTERIKVFAVEGDRYVFDGFHRLSGYKRAGRKHVPSLMWSGTWEQAIEAAARANHDKFHLALKRTAADRTRAARMLLGVHPEWTDRKIALEIGVSPTTVGEQRAALESEGVEQPKERVSKDGKRIKVKKKEAKENASVGVQSGHWRDVPLIEFLKCEDGVQARIDDAKIETAGELWDSLHHTADAKELRGINKTDMLDLIDELKTMAQEPGPAPETAEEYHPAKGKPGSAKWEWALWEGPFGILYRAVKDDIPRRWPEAKGTPEYEATLRLMEELNKTVKPLRKRLGA